MARTKVEEALAEAERSHEGDPERAELLRRARRFKASWLELAEGLSEVRRAGHFKRWGFATFEDYARRELHLRQETADKLTGSYQFLRRSAPQVLDRDGLGAPIPSYQSIDFLRRAEEQEGVPGEAIAELRRRVIDEAAPLPALSRKFREVVFPRGEEEQRDKHAQSLRATARRLADLLDGTRAVPRPLAREVGAAVARLIEALGTDEAEAA